jgi:hypothetical protein
MPIDDNVIISNPSPPPEDDLILDPEWLCEKAKDLPGYAYESCLDFVYDSVWDDIW